MSKLNIGRIQNENEDGSASVSGISTFSSTAFLETPKGTTAQRPDNPQPGMIRFNTDSGHLEYYTGDFWDEVLVENNTLDGGNRGIFAGNNPQPADGSGNTIEYVTISSLGNTINFGSRIGLGRRQIAAMSDRTRAVFAGSYAAIDNVIDFVTISSTGNAQDFGDTLSGVSGNALTETTGISNSTRGIMAGGRNPAQVNVISYITIQATGNAIDFGDLTNLRRNCGSLQSSTRGIIGGGRDGPGVDVNIIEYITISTCGNAIDFGDLDTASHGRETMGGGNSTRGIFAGGFGQPSNANTNTISFITIASTGNAQDFGDLTSATAGMNTMASSPTRACMFGSSIPARTLSYVTIASTGNAISFGNFTVDPTSNYYSGCSNGHGGL